MLALSLGMASMANAAVAQLGAATSLFQSTAGASHSLGTVTIPAGSNRVLIVTASHGGYQDVTAVSFGGTAMTKAIERDDSFAVDSVWYLALGDSASLASGIVSAQFATPSPAAPPPIQSFLTATAFSGADQMTPVSASNGFFTTSVNTGSTLSVASASGDLVLDIFEGFRGSGAVTPTEAAGQTLLASGDGAVTGASSGMVGYRLSTKEGSAPTASMGWTSNAEGVIHLVVNLRASAPSVSIAVSPASVSEDGGTNLTFTVTRNLNLPTPTVVNITTAGTATAGIDYTGSVATVTIPAGATTAQVTINPTVDGTVEADETVILSVASGSDYTVGVPASATGTILNDDVPSARISVSPSSVAEDDATSMVFTVTLNQAAFTATTIHYTIGGTATNGTDYATIASQLVIPAGSTFGTITVNPTADTTVEPDETVTLILSAGAGYTVGVPNSATGTIFNDDLLPNLLVNDVTASEGNAGTTNFTFTVSLSKQAGPGGVTFDIATANGTATAGVDYVAKALTGQTIPAGNTTYNFTVQVNGDVLNEPDETFFVNVTNVVNATAVDGQGLGTITNDDPLPSLSINDVNLFEGNAGISNAVFTVSLSAASGQTVSVNYATADGTATQPSDYTATSGTLTFTPGQTSHTITVPVNGDTTPEANETFFVNLSGAVNATIADNQGQGTINNDDVSVVVSPATVPNGTVTVAYSQALTGGGGSGPYAFMLTAGALPAGLTLSSGGLLSGTPTAGGAFNFTVTATDSSGAPGPYTGSRAYALNIASPTVSLSPATVPNGTRTVAYSATLAASGGTAPYTFAVTAGVLPGGLSLSTGGVLSGTPTAIGSFNFAVTATDSSTGAGPYTASRAYTLVVADAQPVASNSSHTVAYGSSGNVVPLGLSGGAAASLNITTPAAHGTAVVSGVTIQYTPAAAYAGSDSFAYIATNASGTSAPATVTLTVSPPTLVVNPSGPQAATVGSAYTRTFTWSGGAAPYSSLQVQNLPAGLSVTATTVNSVTVSGTPTVAGAVNLSLSAVDSSTGTGPFNGAQTVVLTVGAPTLALTPTTLPNASAYGSYSQTLAVTGGLPPHVFTVTAGALPPGLTLSPEGGLAGTAGAPGTYHFTVTATDSSGTAYTGSQAYALVVAWAQTYSGPSPTGSGTITASFTGGGAGCVFSSAQFIALVGQASSPPANTAPAGVQFPYGLFDFATTGCTPGSTLQFSVAYPGALPANTQYWKYGPTPSNPAPHWYALSAGIAGAMVTFSITDGGVGDDNLAADGVIVDAGGAGFVAAATAVAAVPLSDGLMWWLSLSVLAVASLQRRRVTE